MKRIQAVSKKIRGAGEKKNRGIRRSLRWKLTVVITLMMLSAVSLLTWMQISVQAEMMEDELQKRSVLMKDYLIEQGKGLVSNLLIQVEKDIAAFNFSGVAESVNINVKKHRDIKYAVLISSSGVVFVHTLYPEYVRTIVTDQRNLTALNRNTISIREYEEDGPEIEIIAPVQISTQPWGVLRAIYTKENLNAEIRKSEKQIKENIRTMMLRTLLTSAGLLAAYFFLVFLFSRRITTPLIQLTHLARKIARGDFSFSGQVDIRTEDEVGMLARAFADMGSQLRHSYKKLAEYSRTLEQKVADRTAELKQKNTDLSRMNEQLESALKKLKESQAQLIQSEKMAALGQLIAGIAHEINNPLGVVRGAAQNIFSALDASVSGLPHVFRILPEDLHPGFFELLNRIIRSDPNLSTRNIRKNRRMLTSFLKNAGIAEPEFLADMMAEMGLTEKDDDFMALLKWQGAAEVLKTLSFIYGLRQDGRNILTAVERASKIVFALKKFAYHDPEGKKTLTDIPDCIETVLTLYQNQIRQGVNVIRSYGEVPPLFCFRDELNQVWINLIHNALQAMSCRGILEIGISAENNFLHVSIADSGIGIPEEIRPRIFEPFFTTKDMGEGSGLGLDICRKIVDRHDGKIEFESRPGRTVFHVWMPLEASADAEPADGHDPGEAGVQNPAD
ncbi:MAG: ATP-binding protein [Desulfobacterales bacterium]